MVLHLLPKKSWNVYNQDNVERVRRDEEAARLAEERRKADADRASREHRIELLRNRAGHETGIYEQPRGGKGQVSRDEPSLEPFEEVPTPLPRLERHLDLFTGPTPAQERAERERERARREALRTDDALDRRIDKSTREPARWYNASPGVPPPQSYDPKRLQRRKDASVLMNDPLRTMKRGLREKRENSARRRHSHHHHSSAESKTGHEGASHLDRLRAEQKSRTADERARLLRLRE